MSRDRLNALRERARYEELKAKAGESSEESDLRAKAFAPLPDVREIEKSLTPAWQSGLQGVASGMAGNLDDEIAGVASGIKAAVTLNDPVEAYNQTQGAVDDKKKLIKEANPIAGLSGNIAGSMLGPGIAAKAGSGLLKTVGVTAGASAGIGAANRAADNTGIDRITEAFDPASVGTDAVLGAALGAGGYGVSKGIQAITSPKAKIIEPIAEYTQATQKGLKEGTGVVSSIVKALDNVLETGKNRAEASALAGDFRRQLGSGKSRNMSDKDVLAAALLEPGDNQIKKWVAKRAGVEIGTDSDAYGRLLNESGETTKTARNFDKDVAGKELAPMFQKSVDDLQTGVSKRFGELQSEARQGFSGERTQEIVDQLDGLLKRAEDFPDLVARPSILKQARKLVLEGMDDPAAGLTKTPLDQTDPAEQFNRLQMVRKLLDDNTNYAKQNNLSLAERTNRSARGNVDEVLKTSPEKVEADGIYSAFAGLDKGLKKAIEFDGEIDQYKLAKMLNNSDTAKRFRDSLPELKEFASKPGLDPGVKAQIETSIAAFSKNLSQADLQRDLNKFRFQGEVGVSGRVTEKLDSLKNKNSLLDDAQRNPELFLRRREAVEQMAQDTFGMPFGQLSQDEKVKLVRRLTKMKFESGGTSGGGG